MQQKVRLHNTFSSTCDVGHIYTVGMTEAHLPELLVQDVPRNMAKMVYTILHRQMDRIQSTAQTTLYTNKRIVEGGTYFFRVIQVKHEQHKVNLLTHAMPEWNAEHTEASDFELINYVDLFIIAPWFTFEELEEWSGLPVAPGGLTKRRNKIFWTALSRDAQGFSRWSCDPRTINADDADDLALDDKDVTYFAEHQAHFCKLLGVESIQDFLSRMPPRFEMDALAVFNDRRVSKRITDRDMIFRSCKREDEVPPSSPTTRIMDNPTVCLDHSRDATLCRTPTRSYPHMSLLPRPTHNDFRNDRHGVKRLHRPRRHWLCKYNDHSKNYVFRNDDHRPLPFRPNIVLGHHSDSSPLSEEGTLKHGDDDDTDSSVPSLTVLPCAPSIPISPVTSHDWCEI